MLTESSLRLERYMDLVSFRQKLTASNIANADTPGYRTKDIDFQSELAGAVAQQPNVIEAPGLVTKNDGNNVNVDRESRLLSENAIRFTIASNLLQAQIRTLRSAIQEGRG
jgi:flagellar basal-body rod protein FlgB